MTRFDVMTRFIISIAVTAFLVLFFDAPFQAARADDLADCQQGQGEKQIKGCSRIIESGVLFDKPISKKNLSTAHNNRGRAFARKGDLEKAIADYAHAISLNPNDASAYYNRGIAHSEKSEADLAITDFNKAINLKPDYASAYNNRGIVLQFKGDLDRAIADYDKAITLKPEYATAYNNRGDAYEKKGDKERAIADYQMALALDPSHKAAVYNLKKLQESP